MTRYTGEFLAALRHRYEETDQPMRPLALEFGIGISTLSAIVEREGWVKRSQRKRGRPEASLLSEAQALLSSLPARGGGMDNDATLAAVERGTPASPALPLSGGRSPLLSVPVSNENRTAAERLEALLVQEIEAEETLRAELGALPRLRSEADDCTRRLAIMAQTLQKLQTLRAAQPVQNARCQCCEYDDIPEDIDAFRERLAQRIEAFMESREDEEFEEDMAPASPTE